MRSKELRSVEKNHATVKPDSSVASRGMKTYSESRIELWNLKIFPETAGKNQVSFCHQSSPVSRKAWNLPWKLQELKKYPRKTCGCDQPRGHLSCDTVGRELLLSILSSLLCPESDRNIRRIGKQGCVLILSNVLMFHS